MTKQPAVYVLANKRNGTLYIGVTSDLQKRTWEHKQDLVDGFTKRYAVHRLVYYELHENMLLAIQREKQIKKWNRAWKLELIEKHNSDWSDLWPAIV
jgi:putative endonuclease